jgi:hypothetical protein
MTRDESIALFLQGKDAWNAWAKQMLAERKALENAGGWAEEKDFRGRLEPPNDATRDWIDRAKADFSRCRSLLTGVTGTYKAAEEVENETVASQPDVKTISLDTVTVAFNGFMFPGLAAFDRAIFAGYAWFGSATFTGDAWFGSATFKGNAWFNSATFQKSTSFNRALFRKKCVFAGIKVDRAFDITGARFATVPAFNQADFKQAPDLDSVVFPVPRFWRGHDAGLVPAYRAIRRMAIQGADYEREQMAFKGELRSRRWTLDQWHQVGTLLGVFYDGLADCGRYITRPFVSWLATIVVFAGLYLAAAGVPLREWGDACPGGNGAKWEHAASLALTSGIPLLGSGRSQEATAFYTCVRPGQNQLALTTAGAAAVSVPLLGTLLQVVHMLISAAFIFLFLLAVKNRFKIK